MITPIEVVFLRTWHESLAPHHAHYHLENPPLPHHRSPIDEANFHIIDRNISMSQIGFDYYANVVTYRV